MPSRGDARCWSGGEQFTGEAETVGRTNYGGGDALDLESFACDPLNFLGGDGFDSSEEFFDGEKTTEIKFVACELRHARAGGFKREHERAFQLVLAAAKFFGGERLIAQTAEFFEHGTDELLGRFRRGAGVNREHAGVRIGIDVTEDGVREALTLT